MVELRIWKRELRGDGTNHYEKMGLERILCVSFNQPDMAGMSRSRVCINRYVRASQRTQASHIPDFSHLLVSSISFSSSCPPISFSSTTLPSSQNTKLSHPPVSLQAMIMSWHQVLRTRSRVYTKYSIHRVPHPCKIVCLLFIYITTSWPLNVASTNSKPPYTIDCYHPALHKRS